MAYKPWQFSQIMSRVFMIVILMFGTISSAELYVISPADSETHLAPLINLGVSGDRDPEDVVVYTAGVQAHGWSSTIFASAGGQTLSDGTWSETLTFGGSGLQAQMYDAYVKNSVGDIVDYNVFSVVDMP